MELCEDDEIAVVEFKESLPIGVGFLSMEFDGTLNDRMKGFYRRLFISFVTQLCVFSASTWIFLLCCLHSDIALNIMEIVTLYRL